MSCAQLGSKMIGSWFRFVESNLAHLISLSTCPYRVLPSFAEFYRVLPSFLENPVKSRYNAAPPARMLDTLMNSEAKEVNKNGQSAKPSAKPSTKPSAKPKPKPKKKRIKKKRWLRPRPRGPSIFFFFSFFLFFLVGGFLSSNSHLPLNEKPSNKPDFSLCVCARVFQGQIEERRPRTAREPGTDRPQSSGRTPEGRQHHPAQFLSRRYVLVTWFFFSFLLQKTR